MLPGAPQKLPNLAQEVLAPSWPILGATCCQLGPSWVHLRPSFAPTSPKISTKSRQKPQEALPYLPRPPRGSPNGSRIAPGAPISMVSELILDLFLKFFLQSLLLFIMASLPQVRHGGGFARAAHWISAAPAKRVVGRV